MVTPVGVRPTDLTLSGLDRNARSSNSSWRKIYRTGVGRGFVQIEIGYENPPTLLFPSQQKFAVDPSSQSAALILNPLPPLLQAGLNPDTEPPSRHPLPFALEPVSHNVPLSEGAAPSLHAFVADPPSEQDEFAPNPLTHVEDVKSVPVKQFVDNTPYPNPVIPSIDRSMIEGLIYFFFILTTTEFDIITECFNN